jgi:hypothetical protein
VFTSQSQLESDVGGRELTAVCERIVRNRQTDRQTQRYNIQISQTTKAVLPAVRSSVKIAKRVSCPALNLRLLHNTPLEVQENHEKLEFNVSCEPLVCADGADLLCKTVVRVGCNTSLMSVLQQSVVRRTYSCCKLFICAI